MIAALAAATVAVLASTPRTDTTFACSPETRISIENFAGEVAVGTWTRNAVRIEADHSSRTTVEIERDGSTVSIKPEGRHGVASSVDFRITVPASAAVEISGVYTDVTVQGTKSDVVVETVRGDVNVKGGAGRISLKSVEGEVVLEAGHGRAELGSVNAGVTAKGHDGDLSVDTVNGEIILEDVRGGTVEASTVNGEVSYDGEIRAGGHYSFTTHNGDITVCLPAHPNVTVSVATYSGDFESSFPIKVQSTHRNKRMRFTLGAGAAELELESFQGAIHLEQCGPGTNRAREKKDAEPAKNENPDGE